VFFGSASNNFGVQLLLDRLLAALSRPEGSIQSNGEIEPTHPGLLWIRL